jgi:hypothetical protein
MAEPRRLKTPSLLLIAACTLAAGSLNAHHGGAVYDRTNSISVRGSVTKFNFVFPHTLVYIAVTEPDGETVEWSGELTTPNRLARGIGGGGTPTSIKWTANTLLPGDIVELTGYPARNGAPSMHIMKLVDANGRALIGGEAMPVERGTVQQDPLPDGQGADLRGVWMRNYEHRYQNYAFTEAPPPMTPWAQARFQQSRPTFGTNSVAVLETNDPVYRCQPPGVPRIYAHPSPFEIFQLSDRVVIVYEFQHHVRQIYTDGRDYPEGRPASWMGESVGRWDGDTLVVESRNFRDETWIDRRGVPHSDQLRVTERFQRESDDRLVVDIQVEDPVAFTEPWSTQRLFDSVNWTIAENVCVDTDSFEEFSEFERGVLEYVADP